MNKTEYSAAGWRKSSYSGQANGCVDVAPLVTVTVTVERVGVRDSKLNQSPVQTYSSDAWSAFLAHLT